MERKPFNPRLAPDESEPPAKARRKPRRANGQGDRHEYFAKMYAERKDEIKAKQVLAQIEQERLAKHKERLCKKCWLYPCFEGIENFGTDFAREGCHSFHVREE